jgi:hypothetical protein
MFHLNPSDMNKKLLAPGFTYVASVIILAAVARLIPHWPNFTPVAAIALFGGTYLGKKYLAFLVPLAALFLSDVILGFHGMMPAVYISFILIVSIGFMLRKNINPGTVITASLSGSVLFFLITNFAAWIASPIYTQNFQGLIQCYVAGLAFFNNGSQGISFFLNEITGSLFYNGILFGSYYLVRLRFPVLTQ